METTKTTTLATHNGVFHADEIMGIAILKMVYSEFDFEITRSRNPKDWEKASFVLDVGGVYDPETDRFDHHQRDFDQTYSESVVKYATAGLVWLKYHHGAIAHATDYAPAYSEVWRIKDEIGASVIKLVDAHDNGQALQELAIQGADETLSNLSLSHIISGFNGVEGGFEQAIELAQQVLTNEIRAAWKRIQGEKAVVEAHACAHFHGQGQGQGVMVLEEFTPWQRLVGGLNAHEWVGYCIYPDVTGQWRVQTVKGSDGEDIRSLPKEWGGLRAEELQTLTGVEDATFCHKNLFICGAETKEGALELARLAAS